MVTHVRISCPNCSRELKGRSEYLGHRVRCKHCEHHFRPTSADHPVEPESPTWSRIAIPCAGCRRVLRLRREYLGRRVRCKHCDNTFLAHPEGTLDNPQHLPAEGSAPRRRRNSLRSDRRIR